MMSDVETALLMLLWSLVLICIVVGIAGTLVPAVPGTPLVLLGIILAGWLTGFERISWVTIAIAIGLTVLSLVMDFVATSIGAKRVGASRYAVIGATLGTFAGIFFLLPGLLIGPFVGAVAGELYAQKSLHEAGVAGLGTWVGLLVGTLIKIGIAFAMVGVLLIAMIR